MPTLIEAREHVRGLSQKSLDIVESKTMTPAEQRAGLDKIEPDLKHWMGEVRDLEFVEQRRKDIFGNTGGHDAAEDKTDQNVNKSIGRQFAESAGYKSLMQRGLQGGHWSTGDIEIKTTLTEAGDGASLVAQPYLLPGILPVLSTPLTVASLFPSSSTSSPLIRYLVETAITNAAAAVAEGGPKPESAIVFDKVDETLHKIATFLPISDEMLEDYDQVTGYIDARLQLFVQLAEQTQLLSGDGIGANLLGITARTGLATAIVKGAAPSIAADTAMDAIYRQITAIRVDALIEPDSIVIDPLAWQTILISKNSQGAYYANGPFVGSQPDTLWGKKVVVTPALTANSAFVGAFAQGAMIFRKGGIVVEASNSHASYFTTNLVAIRAEERLGLAVFRPAAFGKVTGL